MKAYGQVARDEEWRAEMEARRARDRMFDLTEGQRLKISFEGAEEPDDLVMAIRLFGRVFKFAKCEFIQLMFLILCVALMLFVLVAAWIDTRVK
jgi:hypothetical protein